MSIYSKVESGTSFMKSRYSKSISNRMLYDCRFHELIPVLKRFVLPGDVWRIGGNALIRFQPMRTPTLTSNTFRVRYFFVPLRQIEENAELIITGSKNGKLYNDTLPTFKNFVADADKTADADAFKVKKYSFWDYMCIQKGDYENIKDAECLPAQYWHKAVAYIYYCFYRDENLQADDDFETWYAEYAEKGADIECFFSNLSKDYFMSALPWQLKGTAPRLNVNGTGILTTNFTGDLFHPGVDESESAGWENIASVAMRRNATGATSNYELSFEGLINDGVVNTWGPAGQSPSFPTPYKAANTEANKIVKNYLNGQEQEVTITQLGFDGSDLRTMMAQTRIFERLARCGSRYVEYLRANFGIAPVDETLQRPKYLGGWKLPIVTTEVLQTAEDGSTPVGTMRGHGISRGGNSIQTFHANEFGLLIGLAEVRPKVQYTTGIPRQFTYKRRFDFFNPSFQHLSEQETRNGELYVNFTPDAETGNYDNDDTFGFQAYANELRSYQDEVCGELREGLSDWNQAIHFTSRPNLNSALISGKSHLASFNAPFAVDGVDARPIIVDFYNVLDVYRPMVRYGTPGLVDHL